MSVVRLFLIVLRASFLSFSGGGLLPILEADLVGPGLPLTARDFAGAVGVGTIAPGPYGFVAIAVGYFAAGLPGAIVSTLALMIPPLMVLLVRRAYNRYRHLAWVTAASRGVALAAVGLLLGVGWDLWQAYPRTRIDAAVLALALLALLGRKLGAGPLLALGAALGVLLYR